METQFKVPSDIPADPVTEGDAVDSPIPDVQDEIEDETDDATDDADGDADDGEASDDEELASQDKAE